MQLPGGQIGHIVTNLRLVIAAALTELSRESKNAFLSNPLICLLFAFHFLYLFFFCLNQFLRHGYRCGRSWVQLPGRLNWTQRRQRLATAATFRWSCVAQSLSRGDGPSHSLHAWANQL